MTDTLIPDTTDDVVEEPHGLDYFLSTHPEMSLGQFRDALDVQRESVSVLPVDWNFDEIGTQRAIGFVTAEGASMQVPLTGQTWQSLADYLDVPVQFIDRQPSEVKTVILDVLMGQQNGVRIVRFNDTDGLLGIGGLDDKRIEPKAVVDVALGVLGEAAAVTYGYSNPKNYSFDVVVGGTDGYGVGGDRRVGDLTKGGLTFGQDTQHNLVPWVQPYLYRLICTNGMVLPDSTLKIEGRGQSVEEVLADLEAQAERAFSLVEHEIEEFYALRNQPVIDPTQTVLRVAREHGISDRVAVAIAERLPSVVPDMANATMFDVVNAVTNQANQPGIIRRPRSRRLLEIAGGSAVVAHASRCPQCATALSVD